MTDNVKELSKLNTVYREQLEAMQTAMQTNLGKEMKKAFTTFFEANPDIAGIAWTQYTPYFNDGDECIFNVHEMSPATPEQMEQLQNGFIMAYELEEAEGEYKYGDKKGQEIPDYFERTRAFTDVVQSINKDIFKAAFGDHCLVIATKDGFQVDEYEHD